MDPDEARWTRTNLDGSEWIQTDPDRLRKIWTNPERHEVPVLMGSKWFYQTLELMAVEYALAA